MAARVLTMAEWRPMRSGDIDGVVAVAATCFPDHFEARACFEERLSLFPQGCFALAGAQGVKGYLIAYPWPLGAIPPLNTLLGRLPESRESFYLHDLALHPDVRGRAYARPAVELLVRTLREMGGRKVALASVNDSVAFWQGMGFDVVSGDPAIAAKLESYGEGASYMVRSL